MNKQNIGKLRLFLMGLTNRFEENQSIFKSINVTFSSGLKEFKGRGHYEEGKISYNFNGRTELLSLSEVFEAIIDAAENYEAVNLIYSERGSNILIQGDNKNVKMTTSEDSVEEELEDTKPSANIVKGTSGLHISETSTLLNRDYYIKAGKADALLKEIGIMSKDGKIKNSKIRKYNQIDHYVELLEGIIDTLPRNQVINILDCGCGKSYLTFVLNYYLTEVKKLKCHFIGIDISPQVIESSKKMAANLGYRNMEFHALDINSYEPKKKFT